MPQTSATLMNLAVRAISGAALGAFVIWAVGLTNGKWSVALGAGVIGASPALVELFALLYRRLRNLN